MTPRSDQRRSGRARCDQEDAVVRAAKGGHGPAEQQDVAQRPGPDDDRKPQGTSMRAVEALPSRSVPRTTSTWGPGEPRFPTGIS